MARLFFRRAGAILLFLFVCVPFAQAGIVRIIAGTSLIEDIARDLTDGRAEIVTMLPGSSCPGHEDVKTTDFVFAARADLALVHSFQRNMPQLAGVMDAVRNKKLRLVVVEPKGSWLIPGVQKQAVLEIAKALTEAAPDSAKAIAGRVDARLARVDAASAEAARRLAPLKGKRVAVSDMQAEFVTWAGLDVLQGYKRGEEMNARDLARMVDALRGRDLAGVIDNYQSGSEAGLPLATELRVPHVVLSNFPGSSDDVPDYFSLLRHNVGELLRVGG
jgi:zinc transport system substrate-binding protein